ncbi:ABC transporter substrate-binding protein [Halanaerobium hydrogeniformans]|uniref:Periplasmic binding protein n=1 Tax=Halanaerobium hydrogeniformans TaxID=656519 RepID=E4RJY5_HALHG|nr:cobalamin-binding protein [Halanaerobium hydrogeniformans]ADQ15555.1 periplasmic binding protein [Halanaerobium hydrogeniformans]
MKKILFFLLNLIIVLTLFSGVSLAQEYPIYYEDDLGREIIIEKEVEGIISLAPGTTEIIYALGLEDKLLAVSTAASYPEEALQKATVGTIDEPNVELIISLDPDLVIAESVTKKEVVERLSELGIQVVGFNPRSIPDTIEMINDIALLTSTQARGEEITRAMKEEYKTITTLVEEKLENRERPKVFYEIWSDPLYTAGKNTFIDSMIHDAGGYNIGREASGAWPQFNIESLIAMDPDVFISSEHSSPGGVSIDKLRSRHLFREISAFQNDRLYIVDQDLVNRPSPRIIEGYKEFVSALFPELEAEIRD